MSVRREQSPTMQCHALSPRTGVVMVDNASRILLMSSPKAGATQLAQLMLGFLDLVGEAKAHDPWIRGLPFLETWLRLRPFTSFHRN